MMNKENDDLLADDDFMAEWFTRRDIDTSQGLAEESEGLGPLVGPGFIIGSHSDINGPGAELVDFTPTRAELMTLAYDYLDRYFAVEEIAAVGQSGSWEWRESAFTWRRFESIVEVLSPGKPITEFDDFITKKQAEIDRVRQDVESYREGT